MNRKRYQYGGQAGGGMDNPIIETNLYAQPGEFVYRDGGKPYRGAYHKHQDGTFMIGVGKMGATHEIKPNEVIIRTNGNVTRTRNNPTTSPSWVYAGTDTPYTGMVVQWGNDWYTTKGGGIEGDRKLLEPRRGKVGGNVIINGKSYSRSWKKMGSHGVMMICVDDAACDGGGAGPGDECCFDRPTDGGDTYA